MQEIISEIRNAIRSLEKSITSIRSDVSKFQRDTFPTFEDKLDKIKRTDDLFFEMEQKRIERDMAWLEKMNEMENRSIELAKKYEEIRGE